LTSNRSLEYPLAMAIGTPLSIACVRLNAGGLTCVQPSDPGMIDEYPAQAQGVSLDFQGKYFLRHRGSRSRAADEDHSVRVRSFGRSGRLA
jgi:hypothetical protein